MVYPNNFVLSALLALGGVRSRSEALAEDPARALVQGAAAPPLPPTCVNAAGAEADLTHNYCFEGCDAYDTPDRRIPNLANFSSNPFKDDVVEYPVGATCGPEGMTLVDGNPSIKGSSPAPPGEATVAIVFKHGPSTTRKFVLQRDGVIVIESHPSPDLRLTVLDATYDGDPLSKRVLYYDDVWSSIEFVTVVVTISDTKIAVYKNGMALTPITYVVGGGNETITGGVLEGPTGNTRLGANNFGSTIKGVAVWTRALSAEEVAGIGMPPATRWDIAFVDVTADFAGARSGNEVVAVYEVSKDRAQNVSIFASRCDAAEGSEEEVTPGLIAVNATSSAKDDDWDMLTVTYDFDEALLGSSNVWNQTSSRIEFCQRLQLVLGEMVIAEDVRQFGFNLTLDGNFNFTNDLGPETVEEADESSSLGALKAFKCDGVSFNPDPSPLFPNAYLIICIGYLLEGVEIDILESMIIDQAGVAPFQVIVDDAAVFPSLTSMMYTQDTKVVVTTRLPINSFDFEAPGASISVSGNAVLKLVDGPETIVDGPDRRLEGVSAAGLPDDRVPEAEFALEVKLANVGVEDDARVMSPAGALSGTVLPALAALFAAVHSFQ